MSAVTIITLEPNQKHRLRWREAGRHRSKTINGTDRTAQRRAIEIEDRLADGVADTSKMTIAQLGVEFFIYLSARVEDKTLKDYKDQWDRVVIPTLGGYRLDRLKRLNVEDWITELERKGVGRETQRKSLTRLRSALKWGIGREYLTRNVALDVEMPKAPPKKPIYVVAPIDVERQRAAAIALGHVRDALIYSLGYYQGLRPGEIFGLHAAAVAAVYEAKAGEEVKILIDQRRALKLDVEDDEIKIRGKIAKGSKTGTIREVTLHAPVVAELREYLLSIGRPTGDTLIFPNRQGGPLTDGQYASWRRHRFNRHKKGICDRSIPKNMRHSCASLLIVSGRTINYVARELGHSPRISLERYQHVMDDLEFEPQISVTKNIEQAREAVKRGRHLVAV